MERTPPSACELLISLRLLIPLRVWQPTIHPRHGFIVPDVLFFSQAGQSSTVIENIHTIIAAAAVKFSFDQLTHLFILIQKVSAQSRVPGNRISLTDKCCTNLLLLFFLFRAGRLKVTAWGRSCSVWSGGSAGRPVQRPRLERFVAVLLWQPPQS